MGLGDTGFFYPQDFFGPGVGQFYVHGIICKGRESSVQECQVGNVNITACAPGETTALACSGRVTGKEKYRLGPEGIGYYLRNLQKKGLPQARDVMVCI